MMFPPHVLAASRVLALGFAEKYPSMASSNSLHSTYFFGLHIVVTDLLVAKLLTMHINDVCAGTRCLGDERRDIAPFNKRVSVHSQISDHHVNFFLN